MDIKMVSIYVYNVLLELILLLLISNVPQKPMKHICKIVKLDLLLVVVFVQSVILDLLMWVVCVETEPMQTTNLIQMLIVMYMPNLLLQITKEYVQNVKQVIMHQIQSHHTIYVSKYLLQIVRTIQTIQDVLLVIVDMLLLILKSKILMFKREYV